MMQGITALPGAQQGPQAQQAPGQATPFQALPAAQPQTPQGMTGQLERLPPQQLLQMFANPADKTPKWAVVSAYARAVEQQRLMDAARGQSAMQQSQMQGQQPPVAAQVMSQPVGIAQGYAGGGAVAFEHGGRVQKFALGADEDGVRPFYRRPAGAMPAPTPGETFFPATTGFEGMSLPEFFEALFGKAKESIGSEEENVERRNRERAAKALEERMGPLMRSYKGRPSMSEAEMQAAYEKAGLRATPPSVPVPAPTQPRANRPGTGMAAAPAPAAAPTGMQALINQLLGQATTPNAELTRIGTQAEKNAQETAALLQRLQGVSPEETEARRQFYETMQGAYAPQRKALEEAKAAQGQGLLQSPEAMARLAAAFGGAKRVGQGLSAAAGAAGEFMGEQRKRTERLSENYDTLSAQLNMTLAQARLADAQNDEKRKRDLLLQAQGLKDQLLGTQAALLKTGADIRRGDISGLAGLLGAQAQIAQAGKPTAQEFLYNLYKKDPKAFEGFLTAQQGPKSEAAERTAMLRALVTEAVKNPLMFQQLPPEMQAIVRQEMAKLGVTSSLPSGANVRE